MHKREHMIVTASGRDRPGVLEEFTKILLEHGGNVEASRMAHLGGEFAMLMLVSSTPEGVAPLRAALAELGKGDYEVHSRPTEVLEGSQDPGGYACGITVAGADHLGIIYEMARCLAQLKVNVETMNTEVVAAPMSGTPLFTMSAVLSAPSDLGIDDLRAAVERMGDELGVSATVLSHQA